MARSKSPAPAKKDSKQSPSVKGASAKKGSDSDEIHAVWLNLLDPTFLFIVPTLFSILFVDANEEKKTLAMRVPPLEEVIAHFTDYAMLIGSVELAIFIYFTKHEKRPLTRADSLAANWHLWNGIVTYTMMDGLNGAFGAEYGFLPILHERGYKLVDRRYRP